MTLVQRWRKVVHMMPTVSQLPDHISNVFQRWANVAMLSRSISKFCFKTLNRANSSDTEAPFLDLNLCISNGTVSTKIYDKRDDFDFDIVNFPFLDGDVPRRTSYGVYIPQLIRFARASSNLSDFNYRNKALPGLFSYPFFICK